MNPESLVYSGDLSFPKFSCPVCKKEVVGYLFGIGDTDYESCYECFTKKIEDTKGMLVEIELLKRRIDALTKENEGLNKGKEK